jgi:hypothetical protein
MTSPTQARQSILALLIALPVSALMLMAPYGLVHYVG